jgi:hypothetical protein
MRTEASEEGVDGRHILVGNRDVKILFTSGYFPIQPVKPFVCRASRVQLHCSGAGFAFPRKHVIGFPRFPTNPTRMCGSYTLFKEPGGLRSKM